MKAIVFGMLAVVIVFFLMSCNDNSITNPTPIETRSKVHIGKDSNSTASVTIKTSTNSTGITINLTTTINDTNSKEPYSYYMAALDSNKVCFDVFIYKLDSNNNDSLVHRYEISYWGTMYTWYKFDYHKTQTGEILIPIEDLINFGHSATRGKLIFKTQLIHNISKKVYSFTVNTEYDFMENSIYYKK